MHRALVPVLFWFVALLPAPVSAHLQLKSSAPANGDTVRAPLTSIRLVFTERIEHHYTSVFLLTARGDTITGTLEPSDTELLLRLSAALADGRYTVVWRATGLDGHVVSGRFAFVVAGVQPAIAPVDSIDPDSSRVAPDAIPEGDPNLRVIAILTRWFNFIFLLFAIGAVVFHALIRERQRVHPEHAEYWSAVAASARTLALLAGAGSLLIALPRLALQSTALHGAGHTWEPHLLAALIKETSWGTGWVLQVLGSAGFLLAVFAAEPDSSAAWWLAGASAVVLAFAPAMSGHAAAMEQSRAITVTNDAAHVLAASTWVGTLAWILCAALPIAVAHRSFEALALLVRKFSPLALIAASAAALTGGVGALEHLGPLSDLWRTAYGRALAMKLVAVAAVGAFGFYNWRLVRPTLGTETATRRLRRSGGTEIGLTLLVLLATAVLIALPTP